LCKSKARKRVAADGRMERDKRETTRRPIIGFTNGVFDILHAGHISGFAYMKCFCDILVVGLNSDKSAKLQGKSEVPRPIIPMAQRYTVLASIKFVDKVVVFNQKTPRLLIKAIRPDILFKGEEYKDKPGHPVGKEYAKKVMFIPIVKDSHNKVISTTAIITKIRGAAQ
jgi:D-beta-D-heptose 7-phosphate kinase/D-beta-D-heptose 1-phosphate adenosyltransferase